MISEEHKKEHLSRAYIHAITAKAGHIFEPPICDYGVDGYHTPSREPKRSSR